MESPKNEDTVLDSFIFIEANDKNYSIYSEIKNDYFIIIITALNKIIEVYQLEKNLEDWKKYIIFLMLLKI